LRKDVAQWAAHNNKVEVDVECAQEPADMAEVAEHMNAVFLAPQESLSTAVPSFWKSWLERDTDNQFKNQKASVTKVGGPVKAPSATSAPDPSYSTIAKEAHYQATTVLWLVVNTSGVPESIRITRPAGLGLDEQAILVVRSWRFDPATKDGHAVPVQISVEVNFKLY
jgi:TonB family protein